MGWGPMDGISALVRNATEHCPLLPCKDTARRLSVNPESAGTLTLDFQPWSVSAIDSLRSLRCSILAAKRTKSEEPSLPSLQPPGHHPLMMLGGCHWVQMPTQLSRTIPPLPIISCSTCRVWFPWLEPGGACGKVSRPCGPRPGLGRHSPPGPPSPQTSDSCCAGP